MIVELCELGDMREFLRRKRQMFINEILAPEDARALRRFLDKNPFALKVRLPCREHDTSRHGDYILPNSQHDDAEEIIYYQVHFLFNCLLSFYQMLS